MNTATPWASVSHRCTRSDSWLFFPFPFLFIFPFFLFPSPFVLSSLPPSHSSFSSLCHDHQTMSFGSPSQANLLKKPPALGSFPLDHDGECQPLVAEYLNCLKQNKQAESQPCRHLTKAYLECRMAHGLMEKESLDRLGFKESPQKPG